MIRQALILLAVVLLTGSALWAALIVAGVVPITGGPVNLALIAALCLLAAIAAIPSKGSSK